MQLAKTFGLVFVILLNCTANICKAQSKSILDKTVTIQMSSKPLIDIFKVITNQTGAIFSYGQTFNANQISSVNCSKKPLRLVLNELINKGNCYYKVKSKYIIVKCDKQQQTIINKISGYVFNAEDSSSIAGASIYIKQNKTAAISNDYGNFTLVHSANIPTITVSFAKENYKDTSVVFISPVKNEVSIYLFPKPKTVETPTIANPSYTIDTTNTPTIENLMAVQKVEKIFWKKLRKFNRNLSNISDTLFSNFSVSLVPRVSTNSLLAFNTVNKYALNILIGYSKGIEVLEIGGLLNIDNGNVKYVQIAGLGNLVAGEVKGFQATGLFNLNRKHTVGAQFAGLSNHVNGNVAGFQSAGLYNYCKQLTGVQTAGLLNIASEVKGAQIAGLLNTTKTVNGAQIAGLMNMAKTVNGTQISGFFNAAKKLNGFQLSLINYADSANGVPLGLFSFVKTGYHKIEIATDETQFVTLGFGSGVEHFYNLLFAGANIKNNNLVTVGYGLGSSFKINKYFRIAMQATTQQMHDIRSQKIYLQQINKFFIGPEFRLNIRIALTAGPTYNLNIAQIDDPYYALSYQQIPQKSLNNINSNNYKIRDWLGFKIALKLL
jgi:hypothetical protein